MHLYEKAANRVRIESDVKAKMAKLVLCSMNTRVTLWSCMKTTVVVFLGLYKNIFNLVLQFKSNKFHWIAVLQGSEFYKVCGTP